MFPKTIYTAYITQLNDQLLLLKKRKNNLAWARLLVLLAGVFITYYFFSYGGFLPAFVSALMALTLYIRMVILYVNNRLKMENLERLVQINKQEIYIDAGQYTQLPEGKEWVASVHDYANDLDIFGRASLYQYINRTTSEFGNETLSNWLLQPAASNEITERQEAVKELGPQYEWRQQLQAR